MSNPNKDQFNMSDYSPNLPAAAAALSAQDRDNLVNALKEKLQHLAGRHSNVMETLHPKVRKRVEVLQELQDHYDELKAEFFEERAVLEDKYNKLYEPLYSKRCEIVNAVVEVDGVSETSKDEEGDKEGEEKGVPNFWLNALKTHVMIREEIFKRDEEALKYLKDIKVSRIANSRGSFKLEFFFDDTNPFFKNSVLTKTYYMVNDDEHELAKAIGTQIEWHHSKCLTAKVLKKKPRKGSKNVKPITKVEKCESFFNFFNPPQMPEDDEIDIESAEDLQSMVEEDYEIGSMLRDRIIPHAVAWFTGEAAEDITGYDKYGDDSDYDHDEENDELQDRMVE